MFCCYAAYFVAVQRLFVFSELFVLRTFGQWDHSGGKNNHRIFASSELDDRLDDLVEIDSNEMDPAPSTTLSDSK